MHDNPSNNNNNQATQQAIKSVEIAPGKHFAANGKKYFIHETFTIGRLEQVNLMEEELAMFSDRPSCHKVMRQAMDMINEYKPGEAYTLLYNKIDSDLRNARLIHFSLRICTAYINAEGEDLAYLTEEQIRTKINDWAMEGLDVRPFTFFAMSVYKELLQNYKKDILNTLTEVRSIQSALNTEMGISNSTAEKNDGTAA